VLNTGHLDAATFLRSEFLDLEDAMRNEEDLGCHLATCVVNVVDGGHATHWTHSARLDNVGEGRVQVVVDGTELLRGSSLEVFTLD